MCYICSTFASLEIDEVRKCTSDRIKMINVYGPLHLPMPDIVGLAVVAVLTLLAAMRLFYLNQLLAGVSWYIASSILVFIVLTTGWTMVDWMALDGIVAMWAMIGSIAIPAMWVILAIRCLFPKQKASDHD